MGGELFGGNVAQGFDAGIEPGEDQHALFALGAAAVVFAAGILVLDHGVADDERDRSPGRERVRSSSERQSSSSAWPSLPKQETNWSMMPTRAPTKLFSARGRVLRCSAAATEPPVRLNRARALATSSAAEELRPAPMGTSPWTMQIGAAKSAAFLDQGLRHAQNVVAPDAELLPGQAGHIGFEGLVETRLS